ncbi:MAG: PQQ-binding-like beta-propeller repeat protein [Thermaerobacter sp.]|nr:PQQ-binding-like beta-propeller repeat protein [Thermaerobacter sp.]
MAKAPTAKKPPTTDPYAWKSHTRNPYLPGDILIADRANNRLLIVNPQKQIVWQFPNPGEKTNFPFVGPDDAFFTSGYREIITNEEGSNTVAILNMAQRKIVWTYGHFGPGSSAPGYLYTPDDAFLYPGKNGNGVITVADIHNQRILFIDRKTHQIIKQYGLNGVSVHNPPTTYAAPNGDFPGPNGGMLVTEIDGSYLDLLSKSGSLIWSIHVPFPHANINYPSDANFTPDGNIIVADYSNPGEILKITPTGKVLWDYFFPSGPRSLDNPSLAYQLKNGMVVVNDDDHNRVIVIDPKTNQIVWQYGHTGVAGTAPGYLNDPDGTDFLPAGVIPPGIK